MYLETIWKQPQASLVSNPTTASKQAHPVLHEETSDLPWLECITGWR